MCKYYDDVPGNIQRVPHVRFTVRERQMSSLSYLMAIPINNRRSNMGRAVIDLWGDSQILLLVRSKHHMPSITQTECFQSSASKEQFTGRVSPNTSVVAAAKVWKDFHMPHFLLLLCSLAIVVESCHITICYTIGVYMVHSFLDNSADESQIGTLTGLLV